MSSYIQIQQAFTHLRKFNCEARSHLQVPALDHYKEPSKSIASALYNHCPFTDDFERFLWLCYAVNWLAKDQRSPFVRGRAQRFTIVDELGSTVYEVDAPTCLKAALSLREKGPKHRGTGICKNLSILMFKQCPEMAYLDCSTIFTVSLHEAVRRWENASPNIFYPVPGPGDMDCLFAYNTLPLWRHDDNEDSGIDADIVEQYVSKREELLNHYIEVLEGHILIDKRNAEHFDEEEILRTAQKLFYSSECQDYNII